MATGLRRKNTSFSSSHCSATDVRESLQQQHDINLAMPSVTVNHFHQHLRTITKTSHLIDELVIQLDLRAEAYAKVANFRKAIQDALLVIHCKPHCAIGYLRAGQTYLMQGKAVEAVRIYRKGLSASTGARSHLRKALTLANRQVHRRIDPVAWLPDDLLGTIFGSGNFSYCEIVRCTHVSRTWRKRLCDNSDLWDNVMVSGKASLLPSVSSHIRRLVLIKQLSSRSNLARVWEHAIAGNFAQLQELSLIDCKMRRVYESAMAFGQMSSLTHLEIQQRPSRAVPLEVILLSCPKLRWLVYRITDDDGALNTNDGIHRRTIPEHKLHLPDTAFFKIQSLWLDAPFDNDQVARVFERCSCLHQLYINFCNPPFLKMLLDLCPTLEILEANTLSLYARPDDMMPRHVSSIESTACGLKYLAVCCSGSNDVLDGILQIEPLLTKSSGSLRDLYVRLDRNYRSSTTYSGNDIAEGHPATLSQLQMLTLDLFGQPLPDRLASLLQSSLRLAELHIDSGILLSPFFFDALIALSNLRVLRLDRCDLDKDLFANYLRACRERQATHTTPAAASLIARPSYRLRSIILSDCSPIDDDILLLLGDLNNLRTLGLVSPAGGVEEEASITEKGLMGFLNKATLMHTLLLQDMPQITDAVLDVIATMPHLKNVQLFNLDNITDQGIQSFSIRQQSVNVVDCAQVTRDTIQQRHILTYPNLNLLEE